MSNNGREYTSEGVRIKLVSLESRLGEDEGSGVADGGEAVPAASASPKSTMATSMVGASLVPVKVTRSCYVAGGAMPSETEMS